MLGDLGDELAREPVEHRQHVVMLLRRPAFQELDETFPPRLDDVRIDELALMAKMSILDEAAVPERGVCRREPRAAQVDVRSLAEA